MKCVHINAHLWVCECVMCYKARAIEIETKRYEMFIYQKLVQILSAIMCEFGVLVALTP